MLVHNVVDLAGHARLKEVGEFVGRGEKAISNPFITRLGRGLAEEVQLNVIPWVSYWKNLVLEESVSPFYQGLALLIAGSLQSLDKLAVKRIDRRDN